LDFRVLQTKSSPFFLLRGSSGSPRPLEPRSLVLLRVARLRHRCVLDWRRNLYTKRFRPLLLGQRSPFSLFGIGLLFGLSIQPSLNARSYNLRLLLHRDLFWRRLRNNKQNSCRAACDDHRRNETQREI